MATAAQLAYPHIVKTPGVRAGKACIDGTRIAVVDVVAAHRSGLSPEEICNHFSSRPLTLAEIHSALAYYYDHREEIEDYFEESRKAAEELQRDPDAYIRSLGRK